MFRRSLIAALGIAALGIGASAQDARIVVLGDSTMEWNYAGVARAMAQALGEPIQNESISGARFSHPMSYFVGPMDIRRQLPGQFYEWVVIAGGANDLAAECDCSACDETLDQLLDDVGLGQIPDFVEEIGLRGGKVLWVQYYDAPEGGGPFSACTDEFAELDARLEMLANTVDSFHLADMSEAIDPRNAGHYDPDRVHPSAEGSARIGAYLAKRINTLR